jgi:hypothetical protein
LSPAEKPGFVFTAEQQKILNFEISNLKLGCASAVKLALDPPAGVLLRFDLK